MREFDGYNNNVESPTEITHEQISTIHRHLINVAITN